MANSTNGNIRQEIVDYIDKTLWAELATVREDGTPVIRTIGAFGFDNGGATVYFATFPGADKTHHISSNNRVSFFFQHEGQELQAFRNAEILGTAGKLTGEAEIKHAVTLISDRSPFVKEHIEKNGIDTFAYYQVTASEVKFLDYSKGIGPQAIEVITL
jgi:general stress protein 26